MDGQTLCDNKGLACASRANKLKRIENVLKGNEMRETETKYCFVKHKKNPETDGYERDKCLRSEKN